MCFQFFQRLVWYFQNRVFIFYVKYRLKIQNNEVVEGIEIILFVSFILNNLWLKEIRYIKGL